MPTEFLLTDKTFEEPDVYDFNSYDDMEAAFATLHEQFPEVIEDMYQQGSRFVQAFPGHDFNYFLFNVFIQNCGNISRALSSDVEKPTFDVYLQMFHVVTRLIALEIELNSSTDNVTSSTIPETSIPVLPSTPIAKGGGDLQ